KPEAQIGVPAAAGQSPAEGYTRLHERKLMGLTSNTTYNVTVTAQTQAGQTYTTTTSFTTAKKRVRVTLESIDITDDGDWFGNGEPLWFVMPIWNGGSGAGQFHGENDGAFCYPNDYGKCKYGSFGEGRFTPLNSNTDRALQFIFAEENFDRFPSSVALQAWAKENDALGGAWLLEGLSGGCPVGDDPALREWRRPPGG